MGRKSILKYHLVWATKYRYHLLTPMMAEDLRAYLVNRQEKFGYKILSLAIEGDHVHLVVQTNTDLSVLVRKLKGGSSFILRRKHVQLMSYPSLWTPSHYQGTMGTVSQKTIEEYLSKQGLEEKEFVRRTYVYKILPSARKSGILKGYLDGKNAGDKTCVPAAMLQNAGRVAEDQLPLRNDTFRVDSQPTKAAKMWLKVPGGKICGTKPFWVGLRGRILPDDVRLCDSYVQFGKEIRVFLVVEEERSIRRVSANIERISANGVERVSANKVLAIDLGVSHPIASVMLSDGEIQSAEFWGGQIKNEAWKRTKKLADLQRREVKNSEEKVRCHTNRIKDLIHQKTTSLVRKAKADGSTIVIGNVRGITRQWRRGRSSRELRRAARSIPYGRIMSQLWYKSILENVPCVFVNEAFTSQRCRCGHVEKSNRKGGRFSCKSCHRQIHADLNGARNIGTVALACLLGGNDTATPNLTPATGSLSVGDPRF